MKYELIGVNKYCCTWAGIVQTTLGVLTILFSFKETARLTVLPKCLTNITHSHQRFKH